MNDITKPRKDFLIQAQFQKQIDFFSEISTPIESMLLKGYKTVTDIMKNNSNYNDMIAKLEEFAKNDIKCYKIIICGLINGILFDAKLSNEFFQYLFVINKDNFDFFLQTIISLIENSHLKLLPATYFQVFLTFDKLIHMNSPKLIDLIVTLCRVFFVEIYHVFLKFLLNKINWITSNSNQYVCGLVFIKILRLTVENHFMVDYVEPTKTEMYKEIVSNELQILNKLWVNKRDNILFIGKELIRNIIPISKANIPEINTILEDIAKTVSHDNISLYQKLLTSQQHFLGLNPYVHILIPPLMEKMIVFILTEVKRSNYSRYITWLLLKFQISSELEFSIFSDITRFIITCYSYFNTSNKQVKSDFTPRWILLGYILKNCRNELISGEVKQAIFFDWLFYNKEKDHFPIVEPGLSVIYNSIKDFPNLTMELIEFIDTYAENFDPRNKAALRNSVGDAFRQAEAFQMFTLKRFMKEENITDGIKRIYEALAKVKGEGDSNISIVTDSSQDDILMSVDLGDTQGKTQPNQINTEEIIKKSLMKERVIKNIENEFYIHPSLDELISPVTLNNFLNYKTKSIFNNLLEEICKQYVNKLKSQNLLDSKLLKLQPFNTEIYSSFANLYLSIFKDELIINSINDDNNIEGEKNKNSNASLYLIDFMISKYFEKNEKEFQIILEFVKHILIKNPEFIVKIINYFTKKYISPSKSKLLSNKNLFFIFSKLLDNKMSLMKETFTHFFNSCLDSLELETINYFFENGLIIFSSIFVDDSELISNIIQYSNGNSLNKIIIDITSNKYSLIEESLYKIINTSIDFDSGEQDKLWMLILAHNNLNRMTSFKEFLRNIIAFSKNLLIKNKSNFNCSNELFKNIIKCVKFSFNNEINPDKFTDYYQIFDFPAVYAENVYIIFSIIHTNFTSGNGNVNYPGLFSMMMDEYIKQVDSYQDKIHYIENFLKLLQALVNIEKRNNFPNLFDPFKFNLQNLKNKIQKFSKIYQIKFD